MIKRVNDRYSGVEGDFTQDFETGGTKREFPGSKNPPHAHHETGGKRPPRPTRVAPPRRSGGRLDYPPFTPGALRVPDLGRFTLTAEDDTRPCAIGGCERRADIVWRDGVVWLTRPVCAECAIRAAVAAIVEAWVCVREDHTGAPVSAAARAGVRCSLEACGAGGSPLSRLRRVLWTGARMLSDIREEEGYWTLRDHLKEHWTLGGTYGPEPEGGVR